MSITLNVTRSLPEMSTAPCPYDYPRNESLRRAILTYVVSQKEVALLSQRGREMLRVIEYFAKSLKITQDHSK